MGSYHRLNTMMKSKTMSKSVEICDRYQRPIPSTSTWNMNMNRRNSKQLMVFSTYAESLLHNKFILLNPREEAASQQPKSGIYVWCLRIRTNLHLPEIEFPSWGSLVCVIKFNFYPCSLQNFFYRWCSI